MTALSDVLEDRINEYIFENTSPTAIGANVYVGLFTAAPSDTGGGTEVSGGSYAREAVSTAGGWTLSAGAATVNASDIDFGTASADWGTITHVGIFDAPSGGNLLIWGALTASKTVSNGDSFKFAASQLSITIDN